MNRESSVTQMYRLGIVRRWVLGWVIYKYIVYLIFRNVALLFDLPSKSCAESTYTIHLKDYQN